MPSTAIPTGNEAADNMVSAIANPAAATTADVTGLAALGAGFRWIVYGWSINANGGANTVVLLSGATAKTPLMGFAANAGSNMSPNPEVPLFIGGDNEAIRATLSAATAVGIQVWAVKARV